MCKYCDYIIEPEKNDAVDLVVSKFKVNNIDLGEIGVDLIPSYNYLSTGRKVSTIRLYIRPTDDDYYTQVKTEINFCPMCGKDLRNLPPDED